MPRTAFAGSLAAARRAPRAGFTLIELMVVVGIAALLLTISATAFFGASRTENLTRSRNQLRDVLLMARQQACITQKPHVVICYNVDSEIEVGGATQQVEQGRFALFRYVGRVWPQGDKLAAPFGFQRDLLSTLTVRERVLNLDKPDQGVGGSPFMRVSAVARDDNLLSDDSDDANDGNAISRLSYEYYDGQTLNLVYAGNMNTGSNKLGFYVAELDRSSGESQPFPLGVRVTGTYSLPRGFAFSNDRTAFVFTPDGLVRKGGTVSASMSVGGGNNAPSFSIDVATDGSVTIK